MLKTADISQRILLNISGNGFRKVKNINLFQKRPSWRGRAVAGPLCLSKKRKKKGTTKKERNPQIAKIHLVLWNFGVFSEAILHVGWHILKYFPKPITSSAIGKELGVSAIWDRPPRSPASASRRCWRSPASPGRPPRPCPALSPRPESWWRRTHTQRRAWLPPILQYVFENSANFP